MIRIDRTPAVLGCAALLLCTSPVAAQSASRPTHERVPVTVAVVDELPVPEAPFVLLRRPASAGGDLILLSSAADAAVLSDAVRALLTVRGQQGDTAPADAMLRVSPPRERRPALPWAARVMNDLERAPRRTLEGVGTASAVEIWLPRQTPRRNR